jgi:hypothetical protein
MAARPASGLDRWLTAAELAPLLPRVLLDNGGKLSRLRRLRLEHVGFVGREQAAPLFFFCGGRLRW